MNSTKENTIDKDIIIKNYENMLRNIFIQNRSESENCRRLNVTSSDTQIRFCIYETWPDGDLVEISNMSDKASMLFDFDLGINQVYIGVNALARLLLRKNLIIGQEDAGGTQ